VARSFRILLIEDDPDLGDSIRLLLERSFPNCKVDWTLDGNTAIARLEDGQLFHLVLADHGLPGFTGIQIAQRVRARRPRVPFVLMTAFADPKLGGPEIRDGTLDAILRKPVGPPELIPLVRRMIDGDPARSAPV
jgi:CheY-like chemotaxis protein